MSRLTSRLASIVGIAVIVVGLAWSGPGKEPAGEKYALLIGVRKYDPNELRNLPYAEADVAELSKVLLASGYRPENVVLMTQTAGAEDTRYLPLGANIRKELKLLLKDRTEADTLLVAFAGHGVQFKGEEESYFCPVDARLADASTLVPLAEVYKEMERSKAGLKVLLVDACRNDPRSDPTRSVDKVKLESVTRPQSVEPPGGVVALFSCSGGEKAFENDDLRHGVFFHFVIEALGGGAVGEKDEEITLPDLEKYVKRHVSDFVRANYGVRQMPELKGTSRGLVPLVAVDRTRVSGLAKGPTDEGMWLFNDPPRKHLKAKYNFNPTPTWLDHVQRASVRFNSGGSGAIVSPDGLVITCHHVGGETLQGISDKDHDYLRDGFYARTRGEEKPAAGLELNVLMDIEDVTDRVNAEVTEDMTSAQAAATRGAAIDGIEKKSLERTGLRSNVVTLYNGGQYHLYRYKRYTDVRLVFAPEQQVAFFGGDPDNFEYPRHCLDVAFFRVYEGGEPARTEQYFQWNRTGAKENDLVFVSGNPGRTSRQSTVAELEYLRDAAFPFLLERLTRMEKMLTTYGQGGEANAQKAKELLFSVQNSLKARQGALAGLRSPTLMAKKRAAEAALRQAVARDPRWKDALDAWDQIAGAEKVREANIQPYTMLESGAGFNSDLFSIARTLVRAADERARPSAERLREYRETNLDSLKRQLYSPAPLYDDFEEVKLANSLAFLVKVLGPSDPLVVKVLNGKTPQKRSEELVRGTRLKDVAVRRKYYEGGKEAVAASDDAMIELARMIDPESRAVRRVMESRVDAVTSAAYARIARAKFGVEGTTTYPDATFTLRLAFGIVKGYEEDGKLVPYQTRLAGLYRKSAENEAKAPYDLPSRWLERKSRIDLQTPMNFVCTADIIGGNSGSPVLDRNGDLVGLIFDGNFPSLTNDFVYTDEQARAVCVNSQGILEALRKVYDASTLADELTK